MSDPLVSVIIPAYRCTATICQAVDSALKQTVSLEILVINDCSPDDLDTVMSRYANEPTVHYIKNETNLGAAKTRNKGVALAHGKYVAFLDADDWWAEGKLSCQLSAMAQSGAVLCATARELVTEDGKPVGRVLPIKERVTYKDLLRHNSIACSSVLLETVVARQYPMHHEELHEDYILWLEILKEYGWAYGINRPFLYYRCSKSGKSGSKLHSAGMTFRVYRQMGFGIGKSILLFSSYAINGVWKYYLRKGK